MSAHKVIDKLPVFRTYKRIIDDFDRKTCQLVSENHLNRIAKIDFEASQRYDTRIHIIHIIDTDNVGDIYCGPEYYLSKKLDDTKIFVHDFFNIQYNEILSGDCVVLGGGGLVDFSDEWNDIINKCINLAGMAVLWGVGINTHIGKEIKTKIDVERIKLAGYRDIDKQLFVPCVSCMLPYFDKEYNRRRRIGIVEHKDYKIDGFSDCDRIVNDCSLDTVMHFIGESECILTNSYHAYYWSILMKKKVVLYKPFSNKFEQMKYDPVIYSGDIEKDLDKCIVYDNVLAEAREANESFFRKFTALLSNGG